MLFQANLYTDPYMMNDASAGAAAGVGMMGSLFYLALFLVYIVALVKVFQKAGREWWEAVIPLYNTYVMIKVAGKPGWWFLLFFIPFVNIIAMIIVMHNLSMAFGHGVGFTLGLIFLGPLFLLILGFGSSQYQLAGATASSSAAPMPSSPAPTTPAPSEPAPMPADPMSQPQA